MAAKYLYGEALRKHQEKLSKAFEHLDEVHPLKAEGDLGTHCCIADVPVWQAQTEAIRSLVFKGHPLEEGLEKYGMSENDYYINLDRLAHGEGVDW